MTMLLGSGRSQAPAFWPLAERKEYQNRGGDQSDVRTIRRDMKENGVQKEVAQERE